MQDCGKSLCFTDEDSLEISVDDFILSRNELTDQGSSYGHSAFLSLAMVFAVIGLITSTFGYNLIGSNEAISSLNTGLGLREAKSGASGGLCDSDSLDYDPSQCQPTFW